MSEIVERVARAICKTNIYDSPCVAGEQPPCRLADVPTIEKILGG